MADTTTANLGLLIADLNDTFNFGAHVENNFTAIDGLMGAVDCTSAGRPTTTYKGQIAYEHDSGRYVQNTGTKASPVWTYMSQQAKTCTSGARPTLGLTAGMLAYETDTHSVIVYDGANWHPSAARITATPTATTSLGTATSGTTETMDSVLGVYQFQAVAGRRYEYRLNGLIGNGSVAADVFYVKLRDSQSAATPTTSSQIVAEATFSIQAAGTAGRLGIALCGTFIATVTGTHTVAFFAVRASGTGVLTPVAPNDIARELYVIDLGAAI